MSNAQSAVVLALLMVSAAVLAEDKPTGFLCCNMRTDGSWISDINYAENGKKIIPVGTPIKVTGYGRYRANIEIDGKKQSIGNDYSRDLDLPTFAKRYVVPDDPAVKIQQYSQKIQDAIKNAHVIVGMTREQVLMSVGYPVSSETQNIDAKVWKFWLSSFKEFHVKFDDAGKVVEIEADSMTKSDVEGQ